MFSILRFFSIIFLSLSCFLSCNEQSKKEATSIPKAFTSSWNQFLGNTKTAHYTDEFVLSKEPSVFSKFEYRGSDACPPIVSEGIIYFGTAKASIVNDPVNYVYAINENGKLKWKKEIKGNVVHSLAISKGVLVVMPTENEYIYGLDVSNGKVLWKTKNILSANLESIAPVIDGNKVYIDVLLVLDINTGKRLNNVVLEENDWRDFTYPVFKDSIIYTSYSRVRKGGVIALHE